MKGKNRPVRLDRFESVLDRLQDVITEGTWETALTSIADFVGAESADITMFDSPTRTVREWYCARVDLAAIQKYATEYVNAPIVDAHPRLETVASLKLGEMKADSEIWSSAERNKIPFFAEFFQPLMHVDDCLMSVARASTPEKPAIVLTPHFREAPDLDVRRAMAALLPHVRRTRETEERLRIFSKENDALLAALDRVTHGVVFLDANGRVAQGNAALWTMARASEGFAIGRGRYLRIDDSVAMREIQAALSRCSKASMVRTTAQGIATVMIPRRNKPALSIAISPLPSTAQGAYGAIAVAFISDPLQQETASSAVLRQQFDLTESEAELAIAIAKGTDLKNYAASKHLTYTTVRTYVRRICTKLSAHSQRDIARIVSSAGR